MLANVHVWPLLSIMLYIIGIIVLLFFFQKMKGHPGRGKRIVPQSHCTQQVYVRFFVDDNIMMGSLQ